MDERLRFFARLLDGEAMSEVCRAFGISRKTGYKIFERYKEPGLEALTDRSRRPVRYANQLPRQIESLTVVAKRDKPHWGARKIREFLVRRLDGDVRVPAKSTIHAVLHRHGLVKVPGRPRHRVTGTPLSTGAASNDLWCADFKGEFKLGNGVVRQSGGAVRIRSRVGDGTTVQICLPRANGASMPHAESAITARTQASAGARILVVDDDSAARWVIVECLRNRPLRRGGR
jgi:transposase